jgi:hypothetical protein
MNKKSAKKKPAVKCKFPSCARIELTQEELTHLRNLMSVSVISGESTLAVSHLLSLQTSFSKEAELWKKITDACVTCGLVVGRDAPDYLVSITQMHMGVYQLEQEKK